MNPVNVGEPHRNPIIEWAENRLYWEKYIWKKCLEKGNLIDEELKEAYNYFKMDNELLEDHERPDLIFEGLLPTEDLALDRIYLKEVKGCVNVNAIPEDQSLLCCKQLTLCY